jgi:3-deoxy-D-manno-octulosonic-acid transferase
MFVFYNISISALFLLLLPLSIFYVFSKTEFVVKEFLGRLGFYPKSFMDNIKLVKKEKKDLVWIHAASLGEIKMATTIINELKERQANLGFIVSTNSSAGRQMAERLFGREQTLLIPIDLPWIIKHLVEMINPKLSIFVEFEARPNFIYYLSRTGSKLVLINGSMDNKILKDYDYFPGLLAGTLRKFDFLGMKTEEEVEKVKNMGIERNKIEVTGNIKMDNSLKVIDENEKNSIKQRFKIPSDAEIIVAGSTHSGEEELIFRIYREVKREVKNVVLILAPRHIERTKRIKLLGESYQLKLVERTKIEAIDGWLKNDEILILDTMGELADLYSIATIVFVGGSLVDKGGHNLFEPVVYGKPVLFGPFIQDFKESAESLLEHQIGIMVKDENDLKTRILSLLNDKDQQQLIYSKASELLKEDKGLIEKCIKVIEQFVESV